MDLAATAARAADCKAKGPQRPAVDEAAVSEGGKAESPQRETAQMLCKALEQGDQAKLRRELCALQAMPDCDQGELKGSGVNVRCWHGVMLRQHAALPLRLCGAACRAITAPNQPNVLAPRWPGWAQ